MDWGKVFVQLIEATEGRWTFEKIGRMTPAQYIALGRYSSQGESAPGEQVDPNDPEAVEKARKKDQDSKARRAERLLRDYIGRHHGHHPG